MPERPIAGYWARYQEGEDVEGPLHQQTGGLLCFMDEWPIQPQFRRMLHELFSTFQTEQALP